MAGNLQGHLRHSGVVVHLACVLPPGREVVVFLEGVLGQHEMARTAALEVAGVLQARLSPASTAIMRVSLAEDAR